MPVDYKDGKIYHIRFYDNPRIVYIGSTSQTLAKRFYEHKNKNSKCSLANFVKETYSNDWTKCYIELISLFPCECKEQLFAEEAKVMRSFKNDKNYDVINFQLPKQTKEERKEQNRLAQQRRMAKLREQDEEGYKAYQREAQKKHYYKTKAPPEDLKPRYTPPDTIEILPPLKRLPKRTINKNELKDTTIKNTYEPFIKNFYKKHTNNDLPDNHDIIKALNNQKFNYKQVRDDFSFLLDKNNKNIYEIIRLNFNRVNIIYCIFTRIRGFVKFLKILNPYIIDEAIKYKEDRANTTIDADISKLLIFDRNDILLKSTNTELKYDERLIFLLLTLHHTRRTHDYRLTKNIANIPDDTYDKFFNYYYDGHLYLWNTKVRSKKQKELNLFEIIKVDDEIIKVIDTTIPFIFKNNYKNVSAMSALVKKTFMKIYNYPFNARLIRRLYCDYLGSLNLDVNEREKIAKMMNHSLIENMRYEHKK